ALEAGVDRDLLQRRLERDADDVRTGRLVAVEVELLERGLGRLGERDAATGDDALLDGRLRVANGVLDAVLALLQLDLGGRADLDDRDAAGQLGHPLLQLLAVVVGVALLELLADLVDPTGDLLRVAGALDDRRLVLGGRDLAGTAEQVERRVLQLEADLLGDHLATGEDRDVGEHRLAAVTEARGLDGDRAEGAPDLVDDQGGQGLALDVLGDDDERLAPLHDLLQQREQVLDRGDLRVDDQDVRVVEHGLHALVVGHEVGRDVALVEAHALGELELEAEGVALLDGDVGGADRRGRGDLLLGLDVLGRVGQGLGDLLDGLLDAPLQGHRVGAGGDVAQTLAHQRLGQHGGGGGALTLDVVGLLGDLLDQLGADLLPGVLELDLLGDAHTVVGDRGSAPLLVQHDVAALGTERHPYSVGKLVHAALESATSLLVERDHLGHAVMSSIYLDTGIGREVPATDGPRVRRGTSPSRPGTHHMRVPTASLALSAVECKRSGPLDRPRHTWYAYPVFVRSEEAAVSVRHGLLALLAEGPSYGYQLRTRLEARTGGTWPLNIGQVYTTLSRLERDGLVEATGADGQATYRITEAGRAAVADW